MVKKDNESNKITNTIQYFEGCKHVDNHLKIEKIYRENGTKTEDINFSYEDLEYLLTQYERKTIGIRKLLAEKQQRDIDNNANISIEVDCMKKYPVSFEFDGELMVIKTSLTFKKLIGENNKIKNYLLSIYLENAIKKWQNEHNVLLKNAIQPPYIIVMKRLDTSFNIHKKCDNDNLENSRIIYTMSRALMMPDNANCMSLYVTFKEVKKVEDCGVVFYLFEKSNLKKFINILKLDNK